MEVNSFVSLQPWLVPLSSSTIHHLEHSNTIQFYTILCDTSCNILYQSQLLLLPNLQLDLESSFSITGAKDSNCCQNEEESKKNGQEMTVHKNSQIPIDLIIGVPSSSSQKSSSTLFPSLFLKINSILYLANHTAIQELTFPKELNHEKLYLLMRWPTVTFFIFIDKEEFTPNIVYEKLSSAVISMNKILKCSMSSYEEIQSQYVEDYQQSQLRKQQIFKNKNSDSSTDGSGTTIGALSASQTDPLKTDPQLISNAAEVLNSQSHLFIIDEINSSLMSWIDSHAMAQHLLQPVLPTKIVHNLLSPYPTNPIIDNCCPPTSKRNLPSSPTPSSSSPQIHHSSGSPPVGKRLKSNRDLRPICLLNLPFDVTKSKVAHSSSHPMLNECLHSFTSSLISIEESDYLEKSLYQTLDTLESNILNSYSTNFSASRASPLSTHQNCNSSKYSEELDHLLTSSYRNLLEDIAVLRGLPRDDRRPLHPPQKK